MKKIAIAILVVISTLTLNGCMYKESQITDTTIVIHKNGQIDTVVFSDFSKEYYNIDELRQMAQAEIDEYNTIAGEERILLEELDKTDDRVVMKLQFIGYKDYSSYMASRMYIGSFADADMYGCREDTAFCDTGSNSQTFLKDIEKKEEFTLICLSENIIVYLPDEVIYFSDGVTVENQNREAKVEIPQSGYSYIIIKNE